MNIGGINTSDNVSFSIDIDNFTSPLSITCKGINGQSKGSYFSWSDLIVTYNYTPVLTYKMNGTWTEIISVYKKDNGEWIYQNKDNLYTLFSSETKYVILKV